MKINNKSISIAFVIILAATVIISLAGMLLMNRQPLACKDKWKQRKYVSAESCPDVWTPSSYKRATG